MNKKKGIFLIIFLVLILGVVNAAWSIYYKKTITTDVIGEKESYTISQEFGSSLSLNTSSGPKNETTLMKIEGLSSDMDMIFNIETRRTYLDSSCPSPSKDCAVIVTQIYNSGGTEIRKIISDTYNVNDEENFTLYKNTDNFLEYRIECVKDSCPQKITSNVTIQKA